MINQKAVRLHEHVPPDWYYSSVKKNIFQKFWHKRRFEEIGKLIEPVDGTILDIGCADGLFTNFILKKSNARNVIGIDVLKKSIDWARNHWGDNNKLKFLVGDAHNLKFKENFFDAVFALEVLEHVYKPKLAMKEINRVLKKDGYAIFLVPTDSLLFSAVWFLWTRFRGRIWKDTHIQTYKSDYLAQLSREMGFRVIKNEKFLLGMLNVVKVKKFK